MISSLGADLLNLIWTSIGPARSSLSTQGHVPMEGKTVTSSRKSVFVVLGFVLASLFTLVSPAQAAPEAATAAAQIDCGPRTSPGGGYLIVCDNLEAIDNAYWGRVWGEVTGSTFVQVRIVYPGSKPFVWQSDTRPYFSVPIEGATSVLIRACVKNAGCGAYS